MVCVRACVRFISVSFSNSPDSYCAKLSQQGTLMKRVWASVLVPFSSGLNEIHVFSSMTTTFKAIDVCVCVGFKVTQSMDQVSS